jgi:cyclohexyl-isocyanide hydratase
MASPRFQVGFLLYPNLTQLDVTGPAQVLHRMPGTGVHYVWKRGAATTPSPNAGYWSC